MEQPVLTHDFGVGRVLSSAAFAFGGLNELPEMSRLFASANSRWSVGRADCGRCDGIGSVPIACARCAASTAFRARSLRGRRSGVQLRPTAPSLRARHPRWRGCPERAAFAGNARQRRFPSALRASKFATTPAWTAPKRKKGAQPTTECSTLCHSGKKEAPGAGDRTRVPRAGGGCPTTRLHQKS